MDAAAPKRRVKLIQSKGDIVEFFQKACVAQKDLMLGIEVERSGVLTDSLFSANYKSEYLRILKKLVDEVGWKIVDSDGKGNIFSLKRGQSFIHTEIDGRIELASIPRKTLFALNREYNIHENELAQIADTFGISWVPMGIQAFAKNKDIKYCPKARSMGLKDYFLSCPKGETYIKRTNGVHVNLGYFSEEDAIKKFQTLFRVAPILAAMFANSPLSGSKFSGYLSSRLQVSQNFDPKRTAVRKAFFEQDFNFEKWVDFVISLPTFYIERKGSIIHFEGQTFSEFMKNGFQGYYPSLKDFISHLKATWTEVMIKKYIEFRSFDSLPPHLVPSTAAIIKGLTINSDAMNAVNKLMEKISFSDYCQLRDDVNKLGLQAELRGKKVLSFAKELLEISSESLKMHSAQNRLTSRDESRFLWPIKEYVLVREQSPAEFIMEMWTGPWHRNPHKLLEWLKK